MTNPLIENSRKSFLYESENTTPSLSKSFIQTLVESFLSRYADELFPDIAYHMTGPVFPVGNKVVEAYSVRLQTDYRFNVLRDFDDEIADIEKITRFRETLAAELRALIAQHEAEGLTVCPYVLCSTGWLIDPSGMPTVKFTFRYGKVERLPEYGDIEPNSTISVLYENSKRVMQNLCNFAGTEFTETLPEYKNFVRGFLNRYGDAILDDSAPQPYLTDDVEIVRLKTTAGMPGLIGITSLRHLIPEGVYDSLYAEIRALQKELATEGQEMAVYAPLICTGVAIDTTTFEPALGFSIAFARQRSMKHMIRLEA